MTDIAYEDFYDPGNEPAESDLVCTFRIQPAADLSLAEAAARVASESSNGTWAELDVEPGAFTDVGARAFAIDGGEVRIAYPAALFEPGSLPQVLSCVAGNVMGMKAVDRIRLADCEWPEALAISFPGPQFGSSVRSDLLDAADRPVLATVPKPKVGLSPEAHAEVGYQAWTGGGDLLKDDENLADQPFNPFEERVARSFERRDEATDATGERKDYLVNVTADAEEMRRRAGVVVDHGGRFVMVDVVTAGWSALQSLRAHCADLGLAVHAHRAMHAAFDRVPDHGVSMRCLAQFARLAGVDHIHTGTASHGKLENEDTVGINKWLRSPLYRLDDVLPVASGGLHPGLVHRLLDRLGTDSSSRRAAASTAILTARVPVPEPSGRPSSPRWTGSPSRKPPRTCRSSTPRSSSGGPRRRADDRGQTPAFVHPVSTSSSASSSPSAYVPSVTTSAAESARSSALATA